MRNRLAISASIGALGIGMCAAGGELLDASVGLANPHTHSGPYVRQGVIILQNLAFADLIAAACDIDADAVTIAPECRVPEGQFNAQLRLPGAHEDTMRPIVISMLESAFGCAVETTSVQAVRGRLVIKDSAKLVPSTRDAASMSIATRTEIDAQGNVSSTWDYSCLGCTIHQLGGPPLTRVNGDIPVYGLEDDLMYDFEFTGLTSEQILVRLRDVYGITIEPETYAKYTSAVVKQAAHNQ